MNRGRLVLLACRLTGGFIACVPAVALATSSRTLVVCPLETRSPECQFHGDGGIPDAIDRAMDGDTILLKAGHYAPIRTRDVAYKDITVRAYLAVTRKRLSIVGESGAVLDGRTRLPSTAIVLDHADVTLSNLEITGFRYAVEEDNIYDGHGVFAVNSTAHIDHVKMTRLAKMGLTGRGDSLLDVSNLQILDGHMGIWLAETAQLRLRNSIIRNNDSCGLGAYDNSSANVSSSVFDGNRDDGLYSEQQAVIFATNSLILNNRPVGAHAVDNSRISLGHSGLFGNAAGVGSKDKGEVRLGAQVIETDPRLAADYRLRPDSPLIGKGDPDFGKAVGPQWVAPPPPHYSVVGSIKGPDDGWDYVYADSQSRQLYLAQDRGVSVLNLEDKVWRPRWVVGAGVRGVTPVGDTGTIASTNSDSGQIVLFDGRSGAVRGSVVVGPHPDAVVFEPESQRIVVVNGDAGTVTLLDPRSLSVANTVQVGGSLEFAVTDAAGSVYVNVASAGEIAVIDARAARVTRRIALPDCEDPSGLGYFAEGELLISACANAVAKVVEASTGRVVATVPTGAGADAVIVDSQRRLAFIPCGDSGVLAVVNLASEPIRLIQKIRTAPGARTGALDERTGRIYLPTARLGPVVQPGSDPAVVPGTFRVVVVGPL